MGKDNALANVLPLRVPLRCPFLQEEKAQPQKHSTEGTPAGTKKIQENKINASEFLPRKLRKVANSTSGVDNDNRSLNSLGFLLERTQPAPPPNQRNRVQAAQQWWLSTTKKKLRLRSASLVTMTTMMMVRTRAQNQARLAAMRRDRHTFAPIGRFP